MLSPEAKRHAVALAAFIVPVLLVKITATVLGADGPRSATGVSQTMHGTQQPTGGRQPSGQRSPGNKPGEDNSAFTDAERELHKHIASLRSAEEVRSPMLYAPRREQPTPPDNPVEPTPDQLRITVTAIMTSADGNITLIDGNVYRVGDVTPDSRWRIVSIDSKTRSVTFEHVEHGERVTREVPVVR